MKKLLSYIYIWIKQKICKHDYSNKRFGRYEIFIERRCSKCKKLECNIFSEDESKKWTNDVEIPLFIHFFNGGKIDKINSKLNQ